MKGKIFNHFRHRWVHCDKANGTANGGKQAVDMVWQKLNLHTILKAARFKRHPIEEVHSTLSLKNKVWKFNSFLFCLLVTFCSEGYTIRLAKFSIKGICTTFMDVILEIFWKYWSLKSLHIYYSDKINFLNVQFIHHYKLL